MGRFTKGCGETHLVYVNKKAAAAKVCVLKGDQGKSKGQPVESQERG